MFSKKKSGLKFKAVLIYSEYFLILCRLHFAEGLIGMNHVILHLSVFVSASVQ